MSKWKSLLAAIDAHEHKTMRRNLADKFRYELIPDIENWTGADSDSSRLARDLLRSLDPLTPSGGAASLPPQQPAGRALTAAQLHRTT